MLLFSNSFLWTGLLLVLLLLGDDVRRLGTFAGLGDDAEMLHAARDGDLEKVIDFLTNKRVSLTTKNNYGVSAVIFAANNGHLEILKELLNRGANMEDRSNNLKTPLLWASLWGHYNVVEYLVERGANISAKDREGLTPLMSSVMNNHIKITRFLLNHGANALTRNYYNGTALSIAKGRGNVEMIQLLQPYYPPEPETSPYKILFKMVMEQTLMYTQIVVDISCSIFGWKAIPAEHLPGALKEEALSGFPTIRQTTSVIFHNTRQWLLVNIPIMQKKSMDYVMDRKEELTALLNKLMDTHNKNWPVMKKEIDQHLQVTISLIREAVQSHYQLMFPVNGTSVNPDFQDGAATTEL